MEQEGIDKKWIEDKFNIELKNLGLEKYNHDIKSLGKILDFLSNNSEHQNQFKDNLIKYNNRINNPQSNFIDLIIVLEGDNKMVKYNNKTEVVWKKAPYCSCGNGDCSPDNHRLCGICRETMLYGSHESVNSQRNSLYAWNTDHIISKSVGSNDSIDNLQAVHIRCNRSKN